MLNTVEAENDTNGTVRLLEPVEVKKTTRAIVTILDKTNDSKENVPDKNTIVELLNNPEFANRKSYPSEEMEARIEELRNSWE